MRGGSGPVLVFGFGTLVVLIALTGLGAYRRGQQIQSELASLHELDRNVTASLHALEADIHLSGIFVRDYLLDPSHLTADLHRRELLEIRRRTEQRLRELGASAGKEDSAAFHRLLVEIDSYWDSLEPVFNWTPQQKMSLGSVFLRRQVLPRRDAVLALAGEIQKLNQAGLARQRQRLRRSEQAYRRYLSAMLAITVSLGLLVAALSILRIHRLEGETRSQQRRTEQAEHELRRLSQQLVQAQEAERKSLSRELHDQVGQMLTALRMELGSLGSLRDSPQDFERHLREAKTLAEQTLAAVRDLATGLRPAMLDDLGLGPALEWQARDFARRSGIPVTVEIDGSLEGLPESHRTCVFRIVQEALTNCARHARAQNIRVAVHGGPEKLSLMVQDDGVGLAPREAGGRGLGLLGIQERVRELGGSMTIRSQAQRGTLLQVEIPTPREVVS
ncbi:MAG: sensor histidine kinase [Bryobacterales bacterium]|nr:sensor histidine kinase [Bryobacteraceae bacterium]MDW8355081.1 sensor histidine kinase [Bryobacterales bacterium]